MSDLCVCVCVQENYILLFGIITFRYVISLNSLQFLLPSHNHFLFNRDKQDNYVFQEEWMPTSHVYHGSFLLFWTIKCTYLFVLIFVNHFKMLPPPSINLCNHWEYPVTEIIVRPWRRPWYQHWARWRDVNEESPLRLPSTSVFRYYSFL